LEYLVNGFPKSLYIDDASYELGNTYFMQNDNEKALVYFTNIEKNYPNGNFLKNAKLKKALIYRNEDKNDKAIAAFKEIILTYPNTQESKSSLNALKQIYVDTDNIKDFEYFIASNPVLDFSDDALDSATYEAAENRYMKAECEIARKDFSIYLSKFPTAIFKLQAHYYKAECDVKAKDYESAIESYKILAEMPHHKYSEKSVTQLAFLYNKEKKYEEAKYYYSKLENIAESPQQAYEAKIGGMKTAFKIGKYDEAIEYANKLIEYEKTSPEVLLESKLLKGKSLDMLGRDSLCVKQYKEIFTNNNSEVAAEAKYALSQFYFKRQKYELAQQYIFDLVNQDPSYDNWVTKSFMLLAETYVAMGDVFQAKETLKSIIDNAEEKETVAEAQKQLDLITQEEKRKEEEFIKTKEELKYQLNINQDEEVNEDFEKINNQ
jgi:TolA-binding protein